MGQEAKCRAEYAGQTSEGKAHLETDRLVFRGDFRLTIPFAEIKALKAARGRLAIRFAGGEAALELGPQAEKWAAKIQNPPSLLDKLGVKPDSRVGVVGIDEREFLKQLGERAAEVFSGRLRKESDLILFAAESKDDLKNLKALETWLKRNGAIWVVSPKGQKHITENDVLQAGKQAGLVDTKVARFSDTHTALKFVIPISRR